MDPRSGDPSLPPAQAARLEATVRGLVQGVGYRAFVLQVAASLDLDGWVANRPDGGVECIAEGPSERLERLLESLREGPFGAVVERVEVRRLPATRRLHGFRVRSWGHPGD